MQQIADWREKLGMSEYAQRFAENGGKADVKCQQPEEVPISQGSLRGQSRQKLPAEVRGLERPKSQGF
jgi:hypothetical protein